MRLTGIIMTKEQQEQFDSWSKLDIYIAYNEENRVRKKLNKQLNEERLKLIEIKHKLKQLLKI
jgi:hypothetical protein